MKLDAALSPTEIAALTPQRLRDTTCVVMDVLRATSTMITALANGAEAIVPVASIGEGLAMRRRNRNLLLAGERNGFKISGFDLGNSPREMTPHRVRGVMLAMTTTNGTVALRACGSARAVYVASILNLPVMNRILMALEGEILFVCAGTHDRFALEDAVCAGAMIESLSRNRSAKMTTTAKAALAYYQVQGDDFMESFRESENGRRLLSIRSLAADVRFCAQVGRHNLLAQFVRGRVVATSAPSCPDQS